MSSNDPERANMNLAEIGQVKDNSEQRTPSADGTVAMADEALPEDFDASSNREDSLSQDKLGSENRPKSSRTKAVELYKLLSILAFGAIAGDLARKGLTSLSSYNGAYISGAIWSNFTACLVMGFAIEGKDIWSQLATRFGSKAQIPLYIGLTTGFCGSFSTFSSMILDMFEKTSDLIPGVYYHYPNAAYGIMEFISVLIAHMCLSIAGLQFGRHIAQMCDWMLPIWQLRFYNILELVAVFLGTAGWIVVIILAGSKHNDRSWTLSCVFAPLAVYSRFYLSKLLNPKVKNFPMGTFTCNLVGTTLLAIFNLLNRGKLSSGNGKIVSSVISCQFLDALSDGFCGCLTTVSTFAVELYAMNAAFSYIYGGVSISVCFIVLLLIMGPYNWVVGFSEPVC